MAIRAPDGAKNHCYNQSLCHIPGGENVEKAIPWFVFVVATPPSRSRKFRCGGSLLNRNSKMMSP